MSTVSRSARIAEQAEAARIRAGKKASKTCSLEGCSRKYRGFGDFCCTTHAQKGGKK